MKGREGLGKTVKTSNENKSQKIKLIKKMNKYC